MTAAIFVMCASPDWPISSIFLYVCTKEKKIFRYNLCSQVFPSIENDIFIPLLRTQDPIENASCNDQKKFFFQL